MDIIEKAIDELKPRNAIALEHSIKYTNHFKPYNANVRLYRNMLTFSLSKHWRQVSEEIKIGLLQELLLKILKHKADFAVRKTSNIDLYNIFIKNIHIAIPKTKSEPELAASFERVNDAFFYGQIEKPNLQWGNSLRKLGTYEYATDTLTISSVFKDDVEELLDYIMYHELLHKKHKFDHTKKRHTHHSAAFKASEKEYPGHERLEKEIENMLGRKRFSFRNIFRLF